MVKKNIKGNKNKEADVQAFVEENYGKTLSSEDIEKSKKSLKETTRKYYDADPDKAKARKKQVADYKQYKEKKAEADKAIEEAEVQNVETVEVIVGTVARENESSDVTPSTEVCVMNGVETVSASEENGNVSVGEDIAETVERETVKEESEVTAHPQLTSLQAYGHSHMGIEYD